MTSWGTPLSVATRIDIPPDEIQNIDHSGYYEVVYTNYLDPTHLFPANFPDPQGAIQKTIVSLQQNGAQPIYLNVEGPTMTVQYHGSPSPLVILGVIIAVGVILGLLYLVLTKAAEITTVNIPGIGKVSLFPILVIGGLALGFLMVLSRFRRR